MGKGKKDRVLARKQEMAQKQQERRAEAEERKGVAKQRRKKQYSRAEDKGWAAAFDKFSNQMRAWNLQIKDVAGDGNCLFRAISDQLYDGPERHVEVRQEIVDHIEKNRDLFEPFVEDDEPFEKYCSSMRKNARWGGNLEIQAASVLYHVNIHIHQLDRPRWDVVNFPAGTRNISLSYHDGEHYNSVRPLPPQVAAAQTAAAPRAAPKEEKYVKEYQKEEPKKEKLKPTEAEKKVIKATGCMDVKMIRDMLSENGGDISATIHTLSFLITADSTLTAEDTVLPEDLNPDQLPEEVQLAILKEESLMAATPVPAAAMSPSAAVSTPEHTDGSVTPRLPVTVVAPAAVVLSPSSTSPSPAPAAASALPVQTTDGTEKPAAEASTDAKEEESDGDESPEEEKLSEEQKEAIRRQRRLERVRGGAHVSNAARKAQLAREKEEAKRNRKNAKVAKKAAHASGEAPPAPAEEAPGPAAANVAPVALTTMRI